MNKEWYEIDVKKEVLAEIARYMKSDSLAEAVLKKLELLSVRDMMDMEIVVKIREINNVQEFINFVSEKYLYYRTMKYGRNEFWTSAASEREIGYAGKWYQFIVELLKRYCIEKDTVLFVGTADGSEIPEDGYFSYYALEQIDESIAQISGEKVSKIISGDFEDDALIIANGNDIKAIVALRCLMPNTRMDKFMNFVGNNLKKEGTLILSHPMGYLDVNGEYKQLENSGIKRKEFEKRLNDVLQDKKEYSIIDTIETSVEYFYILKRGV